jgi:ribosomal protein L37AE/L43A
MTPKSKKTPPTKYIFCNSCRNETKHILQAEHHRDFPYINPDGSLGYIERVGNNFWTCAGCDKGTLGEFYIFDVSAEHYEASDEEYKENITSPEEHYYPERSELHIEEKIFISLPDELNTIYRETLRAFNNRLIVLCALGIRALIEGICADKGITGKNLQTKIDKMVNIPLPQNIVTNLHSIRFIGNEAAHELAVPNAEELRLAIQICEDLLNYIYELDYKTSQLNKSHQLRKQKKTTKITHSP